MNCAPYSCFSEKLSLSPSSVEFLPKSFQRISQMPNTFHLYLSISYTNCSRFPASHSSNINVVSGTDVISLDISSILIISPWWLTDIRLVKVVWKETSWEVRIGPKVANYIVNLVLFGKLVLICSIIFPGSQWADSEEFRSI